VPLPNDTDEIRNVETTVSLFSLYLSRNLLRRAGCSGESNDDSASDDCRLSD
jgi:hypothetical protein